MTRRLHITALTGNGMTTEYRALATPHMGSAPWVPETVQAAARVLLDHALKTCGVEEPEWQHVFAAMAPHGYNDEWDNVQVLISALRALAQEDGE